MFKKSSYSDLEVQEILQTLFQEKKKASELELKLKNQMPHSSHCIPSDESLRLKKELEHLRGKIREMQELHAREKEALLQVKDERSPDQVEAQFENIVQFLRKKAEDAAAEIQSLSKKLAHQDEIQKNLQAELLHAQQAYHKISEELQLERQQKNELLAEDEALKAQMDQLRSICSKHQDTLKVAEEEKQFLLKKLQEQEAAHLHAQQELELLKQMMMKTLQEFTEERDQERTEKEKQVLLIKSQLESEQAQLLEIKRQLDEQQKINASLTCAISHQDAAALAHRELVQFTEELKQKLMQAEEQKQKILEAQESKDSLVANLQAKLDELSHDLAQTQEAAKQADSEKSEHESRLRVAQQHLAKKVREASSLAEKNEDLKVRMHELEHALESAKNKLCETQVTLDAQAKLEKTLQEKYQENLKSFESQAKKWEEKYFQVQEKMQEIETRNRELKRTEERFMKLQQVLIHLNSILGPSLSLAPIDLSLPEMPQPKTAEPANITRVTVQPTLFDSSKTAGRFKENLFG